MPHTMPKTPTSRTHSRGWYPDRTKPNPVVEKHRPGETGRQLAERLKAAATTKPKPKRKSRAKAKPE